MTDWNNSTWFSHDKMLHFIGGFMITAFFGIWANVLVAIAKEMLDEYEYDGFDWKDIIAGIMGGFPVFLLM
jgi:uncharacterized protein YfiM (DUF2279 family)